MRIVGPISAIGALVLLTGCAGLTKADFIARADAICADSVRATRLIAPPAFAEAGSGALDGLAAYASKVLPLVASEAGQLRALPRPQGNAKDSAALAGFLDAFSGVAADYGSLETAATKGDAPGVARAEGALGTSRVSTFARAYGLRSCGSAGATTAS